MLVGIIAVAGAATLLGIMPSLQKQVLVDGLPMNSLMAYTNLIITLVSLGMALLKKRSLRARPVQAIQAVLMGEEIRELLAEFGEEDNLGDETAIQSTIEDMPE